MEGISQGVEQTLKFVKEEEWNLKFVQNDAEIAKYQKEVKTEGSQGNIEQNIEAEEEGPYDDWSISNECMESCVKFPSSTPVEIVKLYRKLDLQRRELEKQKIHTQGEFLKEKDKEIVLNNNQETESKEVGMIQ